MPFLILFVVLLVLFLVPRFTGAGRTRLMKSGLFARGLVLSASPTSSRVLVNGQPMEQRSVLLDIEVPGRPPYEASLVANFPRLCEAFPGTALDLRVDPRNPMNVAVVGPAGASGWIEATYGLFPWAPRPTGFGCGSIAMLVILVALGLGAVISFAAGHERPEPTPAETEPVPARTAPVPHMAPTVEAPSTSAGLCDAVVRCCTTLGRSGCSRYTHASDSTCRAVLQGTAGGEPSPQDVRMTQRSRGDRGNLRADRALRSDIVGAWSPNRFSASTAAPGCPRLWMGGRSSADTAARKSWWRSTPSSSRRG